MGGSANSSFLDHVFLRISITFLILLRLQLCFGFTPRNQSTLGRCGYPGNNANSLTNFTLEPQNFVHPGTVVSYGCDAGYQLFGGEHRVCQRDGTWTGEAPLCAKVVSYGKNMNCTSAACQIPFQSAEQGSVSQTVDNNDNTCYNVRSTSPHEVTSWRLDLLEVFELRVFRFVLRGNAAQYISPRIVLENDYNSLSELKPTECLITKETLLPKGDGYVMTIRPNRPQWARYVNIYMKHQRANEEIAFCEAQSFADNAPSSEQCFHPGKIAPQDGVDTRTVIYNSTCYTFNSTDPQPWSTKQTQCQSEASKDGADLVKDVNDDVKQMLDSYALVMGNANFYWMGGYAEKRPSTSAQGGYEYVPVWTSGKTIDNLNVKDLAPNTCLVFSAPMGIWMFHPCHFRTGAICQSAIKRCGTLQVTEHMSISPAWKTDIGVAIRHECPSGFGLDGDVTRVCQPNGHWSGRAPVCVSGGVQKDKFTMTGGAIAGIIAGVIVGVIIIIVVLFIILRKQGHFQHKMTVQQSESVEALESTKQYKKERNSLNAAGTQNYASVNQECPSQQNQS